MNTAALELSGELWCTRYPGSASTATLVRPFRSGVQRFITALERAGARVSIAATYRPPERAYLMHYAWAIANAYIVPSNVPDLPGVAIEWDHGDLVRSRSAALDMVDGYRMAHDAALQSRHTEGRAIDMSIGWNERIEVVDGAGGTVTLDPDPTPHDNLALRAIGRTYGVVKLPSDPPHWSDDGR